MPERWKFLQGGGRMGRLTEAHDWSRTALGPLDAWPPSLRTAAGIILESRFPAALVWGPHLVTLYNDAFRPILGNKPEALGRAFSEIWAEAWPSIGPIAARAFAGEATFIEDYPLVIERHGVPEEAFFTFCYSPVRDDAGKVAGFLDTVVETTSAVRAARALHESREELRELNAGLERRIEERSRQLEQQVAARHEAEAALFRAQKMEAVGQLTGGIAHDFNNLLTIVSGNLDLLRGRCPEPRAARLIDNASRAVQRGARLTSQLLSFARRQRLRPETVRVDKVIEDFCPLLKQAVGRGIEFDLVSEQGLWGCELDPVQLEAAVLNLAINARDAMPGGGRLEIATRNLELGAGRIMETGEVPPGRYVEIRVSDTGTGMDAEVARRAFEPFFTTKPSGQGSGLGLSMVYGFVQQSGGHLELAAAPGAGTSIALLFPASAPP
jgi:signal transduction histidine kinase